MPFYEYECQACKYYMEVMQKISDAPLTRCPSCNKRSLKKLVSVPVFRLKGAGWYETDFKSDKETRRNLLGAEKEEAKAESKAESKGESKAETTEPKPAAGGSKDSKDARPAEPKTAKAVSTASAAGRHRAAPRSAARRPVRASRARSARKKRR
jgi:putative FmdB family regulatory protein